VEADIHAKFWGKLTASRDKLIWVMCASLRSDEWDDYEPIFARMFDNAKFSDAP
jgi:hypothetical protein